MDNKKEKLQNEQGSVQRQTQKNEQYGEEEASHSESTGIVPTSQIKGSDADKDRGGKASTEREKRAKREEEMPEGIDDEKIIPGIRAKRNPWNSITFDSDDFFGGFAPA